MDIRKLTDDVSVAAQIRPRDLPQVHALGFRSVVCNRPDGESDDQPLFEEIQSAAQNAGLECSYVPVVSGAMTSDDVAAMKAVWEELPKPVLLYCRSGARSAVLMQAVLAE